MSAVDGVYRADSRNRPLTDATQLLRKAARYVVASVPSVTGETLAIARAVFGAAILFFWLNSNPKHLGSVGKSGALRDFIAFIDMTGAVTFLSSSLFWTHFVYWGVTACLILFIIGFLTRFVYPALVALFWTAALMGNGNHTDTPLLLALLATVTVPWGERWSVDAALSGKRDTPSIASPLYGYGIWLLGFTIALTYATAGVSKLVVTDGAWLWNTGARNGFIQDFGIAATDWGIYLTNNYVLALIASAMSAFGQAIYLYSSFTRSAAVKYAICFTVAIPFLVGLVLFMGHFWWHWAVLILMLYVPWTLIDRMAVRKKVHEKGFTGEPRMQQHRKWFLTAFCALVGLHTFAVVTKSEFEPLYSNYPMYADQMPADSQHEREFWSNYKKNGRNFKFYIGVPRGQSKVLSASSNGYNTDNSSIYDVGTSYHFYRNISRFLYVNAHVVGFTPGAVFEAVAGNEPIAAMACSRLKSAVSAYTTSGPIRSVRFAKRYVDIVNGKMVWMPVTSWIEVDVASPDCAYKQHHGDPRTPAVQFASP